MTINSGSAPENATLARAVLGRGLALRPVPGGEPAVDLVWSKSSGGSGTGPALVEGLDNLAQDLAVALLTPRGSDPFNGSFGFDGLRVLSLALGPAMRKQMLQVAVTRTLLADSRVTDVIDVIFEPLDSTRRQVVRAIVRTVLGAEVPMTLGQMDEG